MKICLYDSGFGVLSFLRYILKNNIHHDYYIYIDEKNFPYGDKDDLQLIRILENNLIEIDKLSCDYIFICCNTMSKIYLDNKLSSKTKVRTILEYNLKFISDYHLLCTNNLSNKINNSLKGNNLASYIEENDIKSILNEILKYQDYKLILGCTHYHLLKDILVNKNFTFLSLEKEIFQKLPGNKKTNIYIKKKDYNFLKKYLKSGIKFY